MLKNECTDRIADKLTDLEKIQEGIGNWDYQYNQDINIFYKIISFLLLFRNYEKQLSYDHCVWLGLRG